MKFRTFASALALSAGLCSFSFGQVTGKVTLDGKAPDPKVIDMSAVKDCNDQHPDPVVEETVVVSDKGELKNVVVSLKKEEGQEVPGEAPKETVVIDQKGCMYTPHVVAIMTGQPMSIKNDDPFLHNIHSLSMINPAFNKAQPNKDPGMAVDSPKAVETFKVKCDVHPWMLAWVRVLDHPYFAVTDDSGAFTIPKGLPDGDYTFTAWHEKYGEQDQKITIKDGKATVNYTFKAGGAQANPAPTEKTKVAQAGTITPPCCVKASVK